jgi:hypothetical protein
MERLHRHRFVFVDPDGDGNVLIVRLQIVIYRRGVKSVRFVKSAQAFQIGREDVGIEQGSFFQNM